MKCNCEYCEELEEIEEFCERHRLPEFTRIKMIQDLNSNCEKEEKEKELTLLEQFEKEYNVNVYDSSGMTFQIYIKWLEDKVEKLTT